MAWSQVACASKGGQRGQTRSCPCRPLPVPGASLPDFIVLLGSELWFLFLACVWAGFAGVSMENVLNKGEPTHLPPAVILDLIQNKLNKTQVVHGAIFDLLTSQVMRAAAVATTGWECNLAGIMKRLHCSGRRADCWFAC